VWVSPRLPAERLAELYGSEAYWSSETPKDHGYADYRAAEDDYLRTFRRRMRLVQPHARPGGRALDVGCAAGFFMAVLREQGFEAHGVEVSPVIASHARARFGFESVFVGPLADTGHGDGSFDLVTMWDVLEHVPEPAGLLQEARRLLRPDGLLVIETQNVDSLVARALGRRWHHYKHAEHLYHFNRRSLGRLLAASGFTVDRVTPRYGGKYVSLAFVAERSARIHPRVSRALVPAGRALPRASAYVNLMDEMVVLARPIAA
jgi:2-polyprenyl-3-methyl-5-hydroxy-6-metoxy-1,4-benzoquinol methylase